MRKPRFIHRYGPTAILLDWQQVIDPDIGASVNAYATTLRALPGVVECVPAYASLLVTYSPNQMNEEQLREHVYHLQLEPKHSPPAFVHHLPVCYSPPYAPDLEYVASALALTTEQVVALHTSPVYRVYFLGYQPGFAFMGTLDERLTIPRKPAARTQVPSRSVGLAHRQTGIYPSDSPGGWQLIGRCPWPLLGNSANDLTRFRTGDRVRFYSISSEDYPVLEQNPSPWPQR